MWQYQKFLEFPINIKTPNPKLANFIISQYGGPNGELGASMRYLSQRFSMPNEVTRSTLNDIGTEELAHLEMVGTLVRQLAKNATTGRLKTAPWHSISSITDAAYIRRMPRATHGARQQLRRLMMQS